MYTPDFLIIQRKKKKIYKVIIVETKGSMYANDPKYQARKEFIESEFIRLNKDKFGYDRFEYLYLQDDLTFELRISLTAETIEKFFAEEL